MAKKSSYDGLQKKIRRMKTPKIEVWKNRYPDRDYLVRVETDEFTCICPKTGLPDFAHLEIEYAPDEACIELKSFKLYLVSYRDVGIFHEHAVNRILDDFVTACNPREARAKMAFGLRGGIKTTVEADYKL
jgi:7-cyano-7-deazaguanine reductase